MFIALWAIPLIYTLQKLPNCMRNGEITIRGVYAALLLPLPFTIYTMVRCIRKTRSVTSDGSSNGQCEVPYVTMKRRYATIPQLINVIEGPFRYKISGEIGEKLSWEPILLLQPILLSLCHTFVLQPGVRSLLLLLLAIMILYMNALCQPFGSSFLNTTNEITLTLLCITGIVNAIYAYIYEYGSVPYGPLVQLLNIFDYLEVGMIMIFPVTALVIVIMLAVAKLTEMVFSIISFLIDKCKRCERKDDRIIHM